MCEVVDFIKKKEEKIPEGQYCDNCPYYEYLGIDYLVRDMSLVEKAKNQAEYFEEGKDRWIICPYRGNCTKNCIDNGRPTCFNKRIRCNYLNYTDENENTLLHDGIKECGINL